MTPAESESCFDDVAVGADPGDNGPYLIEVGRRLDGGAVSSRLLRWTGSDLVLTVEASGAWARIHDVEEGGDPLVLTRDELRALGAVCDDWIERREKFWAFERAGHWFRPATYYAVAADTGDRIEVPRAWQGTETRVTLSEPENVAVGVERVADLVRVGETIGPTGGAPVGAAYLLGALQATARRSSLVIERCVTGARLTLGLGDTHLPRELLPIMAARP